MGRRTPVEPRYYRRYGPVFFIARDGKTTVLAYKRADGGWGWTKRRSGRIVATNGEGVQRCRAIDAARREAGPGARERTP